MYTSYVVIGVVVSGESVPIFFLDFFFYFLFVGRNILIFFLLCCVLRKLTTHAKLKVEYSQTKVKEKEEK